MAPLAKLRAVAAEFEVDRRAEAYGLALGQAYFFVNELDELVQGWVVGEGGGEVHWEGLLIDWIWRYFSHAETPGAANLSAGDSTLQILSACV